MCDFSLQSVRSRPAKVGDKLVTRDFGTGTRGFSAAEDLGLAVCVMPGTELAFAGEVACLPAGLLGWKTKTISHRTAIFRQVNKDKSASRRDRISGWADRDADAPVRGSGGNSAATACAASNRGRGGCPEARHLRGLKLQDWHPIFRDPRPALLSGQTAAWPSRRRRRQKDSRRSHTGSRTEHGAPRSTRPGFGLIRRDNSRLGHWNSSTSMAKFLFQKP